MQGCILSISVSSTDMRLVGANRMSLNSQMSSQMSGVFSQVIIGVGDVRHER